MSNRLVHSRITADLEKQFSAQCRAEGTNKSQKIQQLIKASLDGVPESGSPEPAPLEEGMSQVLDSLDELKRGMRNLYNEQLKLEETQNSMRSDFQREVWAIFSLLFQNHQSLLPDQSKDIDVSEVAKLFWEAFEQAKGKMPNAAQ
ncbi:hypothetical protein Enr13x_38110 [Stieleria neptunia]|uniref:Uncharacterized protein n=1 Tax=Stieleria neptunia TaxID=2527979 RepID=A0A518HT29_9BACT|nr:hypothetical protein [Stieleria neptunia]QDV43951.1 hypothetical protein Enr13x_38110 [Stieleria neptunia]